jgi:hypothetical protein
MPGEPKIQMEKPNVQADKCGQFRLPYSAKATACFVLVWRTTFRSRPDNILGCWRSGRVAPRSGCHDRRSKIDTLRSRSPDRGFGFKRSPEPKILGERPSEAAPQRKMKETTAAINIQLAVRGQRTTGSRVQQPFTLVRNLMTIRLDANLRILRMTGGRGGTGAPTENLKTRAPY